MEDYHKYIYFYTIDYKGDKTSKGYTLPITPFTFIPVFDDGETTLYSSKRILWDFGDGTTSESITAVHHFKLPGWYNVKCYILGKEGKGFVDSYSQNILVEDFVTDTIVISGVEYKNESGFKYPFVVYRFNSWQTYEALSSVGYTINLNVSGNTAPILNLDVYANDKWAHLKPYAKFETNIINPITNKNELLPVNTITTDESSNKELFVKLENNNLVFCDKTDTGSCFVGTSGSKLLYYTDDLPKEIDDASINIVSTIFCSFDKKKFKDLDSFYKNYPENKYSVLNGVFDYNIPSSLIEQLDPHELVITSNGMDDDNDSNRIYTFDINPVKFTGQKIPFVARIKEYSGLTSKYNPLLTLSNTTDLISGQIYVELRDSTNNTISDNVTVVSNFGILSSETNGGYFKGYLISDNPYQNVTIYAEAVPIVRKRYLIDTIYSIIGEPQADKIHSVKLIKTDGIRRIEDTIINVPQLTGIYSSCVTCERALDRSTNWIVWVVDADREKILKLNPSKITNGNMQVIFDKFILPENSSPSDICSDKNGNVWVTLYDSVSTIRINNLSNTVDKIIKPSINNEINNFENTVTPASIDTDYENNVWISYSNQLSSFIEKYDADGNFLTHINIISGFQCTEILTDLNLNVWGIAKDLTTTSQLLSDKNDKIFSINSTGSNINYYSVSGSLWNIISDTNGDIWGTKNIDELFKIEVKNNNNIINFSLNSDSTKKENNYISDLEGITCTTDGTILVIDNINKKLHYFDSNSNNSLNFEVQWAWFQSINLPSNRIQDKINGYGDWNGFKYINKFQHIFGKSIKNLRGSSNTFTIYDSNSGKYDVRKINENFDPIRQLNSYRFQDFLLDKGDSVFKLIETFIGTLSSNPNYLGKLIYERISNFSDNIANIDTCNVSVLKSMYAMLDETYYTFGNGELSYPAELKRLIDMFSIKFSKLKGSRNKFAENFDSKGYYNEQIIENGGTIIYGVNKGKELNFFTTVLTAGTNIVAFEKFSETYSLLNTNLCASSAYLTYIDPINRTYALSGLNYYWGWNLSLPEQVNVNFVPRYYSFYEYLTGYDNNQTEGIINWSDTQTTVPENIISNEEWNSIKENIINYTLAKGLGIIK
jgi:hypothetical protein